jgi:hypothetical protein
MNLAAWILTVAVLSAAVGSGAGAALDLHQRTGSTADSPARTLAAACVRSAAASIAAR